MTKINWKQVENELRNEAIKFLHVAYGLELTVPVTINGRLKSTFGRFQWRKYGDERTPLGIEISKNYIEHQDWSRVISTLKHECIHYALFVTGKPHQDGHPVFESEIVKHGSHSSKTVIYKGKIQRYQCPKCKYNFDKKKKYPKGKNYSCGKCSERIVYIGEVVV